jgi:hypothetical protein
MPPAASGAIGRGDDEAWPVLGLGEPAEHRHGEFGGTEVGDAHAG